jgi:uncharacterized protein
MIDIYNIINSSISNKVLHLILFPTEACNFRCVYCYETFQYEKMNAATIEGIKKFLKIRIPELKSLHISWFGGEPLLAMNIIEDISIYILNLLNKYPECIFHADITTNAYELTLPIFEKLCQFKIGLYQISFDGPREQHDKKRILANGKGTFDRIWTNLINLKCTDKQVSFLIRLHLDKTNLPHIHSFMEDYKKIFGDDNRFRLFLRPLSQLGGKQDMALKTFSGEEGKMVVEQLARFTESINIKNKTFSDFPKICYASKLNSFAIRADGTINKCTVALDREYNKVGQISRNGTLKIHKKKLFEWARGIQSGNERELFCPMENILKCENYYLELKADCKKAKSL